MIVLVERNLIDDAAIIVRTLFEIELQLAAMKKQPELAVRLIESTESFRLKRMTAMTENKRPLPVGVTEEAMAEELARLRAMDIPPELKKFQLAEKAGLLFEFKTLYSLLSDIAHVSPTGLSHYVKNDSKSGKVIVSSDGSLLGPEYLMALAAATQLNILELVVDILKDATHSQAVELRQQNGTLLHNIKMKGL